MCEVDLDPAHVGRLRPPAFAAVPLGRGADRLSREPRRARAHDLRRDVGERHRHRRHPDHVHRAVGDLEILARGLEQVDGDVEDALAQRPARRT